MPDALLDRARQGELSDGPLGDEAPPAARALHVEGSRPPCGSPTRSRSRDPRLRRGPATTTDQETLGIAGGILKRRWEVDGRREHLERSLALLPARVRSRTSTTTATPPSTPPSSSICSPRSSRPTRRTWAVHRSRRRRAATKRGRSAPSSSERLPELAASHRKADLPASGGSRRRWPRRTSASGTTTMRSRRFGAATRTTSLRPGSSSRPCASWSRSPGFAPETSPASTPGHSARVAPARRCASSSARREPRERRPPTWARSASRSRAAASVRRCSTSACSPSSPSSTSCAASRCSPASRAARSSARTTTWRCASC